MRNVGKRAAVLLLGFAVTCSNAGDSDQSSETIEQDTVRCYPLDKEACECPGGRSGQRQCNTAGTQWSSCICSGLSPGSVDSDGAPSGGADSGVVESDASAAPSASIDASPQPNSAPVRSAACESVDSVTSVNARRDRRGTLRIVERHDASGQAFEAVVDATFADYSQDTSGDKEGVPLGANCLGFVGGRTTESARHCEYTKTSCQSDKDCASGVACRTTDRLDAGSVSITGLVGGKVALDRSEKGYLALDGRVSVFGEGKIGANIRPAKQSSLFPYNWVFFSLPPPKLITPQSPDLSGSYRLRAGEELLFQWPRQRYEKYEQDEIYIDIVGQQTSTANANERREIRLSCVVKDDGCHAVTAKAIDWLIASSGEWTAPSELDVVIAHKYSYRGTMGGVENTDMEAMLVVERHGTLRSP